MEFKVEKIEATATATSIRRDSARGRAPLSPSPSPSVTDNLRRVLHKLEQYRLGKSLASPDCEQIDLALELSEYRQLCRLLFQPDPQANDGFDCDLAALRQWAPNKLRHDYDPRAARLSIRMLGPLHQKLVEGFKSIILDRLLAALETSGYNGTITENTGIDTIFKEPEPERRSTPALHPRAVPRKRRPQSVQSSVSTADLSSGTGSDEPRETSPAASADHTHSPDFGMHYVLQDGPEPYFPGIIAEVGWSHPLPDWKAKRKSSTCSCLHVLIFLSVSGSKQIFTRLYPVWKRQCPLCHGSQCRAPTQAWCNAEYHHPRARDSFGPRVLVSREVPRRLRCTRQRRTRSSRS